MEQRNRKPGVVLRFLYGRFEPSNERPPSVKFLMDHRIARTETMAMVILLLVAIISFSASYLLYAASGMGVPRRTGIAYEVNRPASLIPAGNSSNAPY